ncbi:ATP-binding protein [Pyruvatibacter sp.]|uniref:ATP-binding protein n=1 Tax=Pyruvatibacter sp. TaxID=1981328 RepID=UPI0032656837
MAASITRTNAFGLHRLALMHGVSVSTKLIAGFVTVSVVAALVGFTGLYFVDRINNTLNNITDNAAPTVETSDDLIAFILGANKTAEQAIASKDRAEIDLLATKLEELDTSFDISFRDLQELVTDETLLDELEFARQAQTNFLKSAGNMIAAHRLKLRLKASADERLGLFDANGSKLINALDEFAIENELEMAKAEEEGDYLASIGAGGARVNGVLGALFDQDYPVVEAALKLQRLIFEMQDTAGEYLAVTHSSNTSAVELEFESLYQEVRPHLTVLKDLAETDEDMSDAVSLDQMFTQWAKNAYGPGQLFETHRRMLQAEADANSLADETGAYADSAALSLDKIAETADAISDGADEAAAGAVSQARTAIALLLVLGAAGSAGTLWVVIQGVVRPVRRLTDRMVSFGAKYGQGSRPTAMHGDEIEQLGVAFSNLQQQVRQRTEDLQKRSVELDKANIGLEEELAGRHLLEQQLVRTQKLEGLGTLAGGIAHDFNNMLYVILGCSQMALEDTTSENPVRPLLEKINQAATQSASIVSQILFFSRQEEPDRQPVDVAEAVVEAMTLLRAGLPSSMILEIDHEEDCGILLGDEVQIQQVAVNLVTNAFQAYREPKGTIKVSVGSRIVSSAFARQHIDLRTGRYVVLSIEDQAGGISDDIQMKMFDPFFTTKPVGEGTGLGLAVVHGIVKAHGGAIVVSTQLGQGTTFDVYLPEANQGSQIDVLPSDVGPTLHTMRDSEWRTY